MRPHHHAAPAAADTTGCPAPARQQIDDADSGAAPQRPLAEAWISEALITEGIAVWSRLSRRAITRREAIDMLMNIKQFGEVLLRIAREWRQP